MPHWIAFANPRQIRRWCKYAQAPVVLENEVLFECSVELPRPIITRPDRVIVHADRHYVTGKSYRRSRPSPTPQIVCNFPWADPADDREYQGASGLHQPCAFARHVAKGGYAIERTEIGIDTVIQPGFIQATQFVRAQGNRPDSIRRMFS